MREKRAIFTAIACGAAAALLTGVLAVGLTSDNFGLSLLKREAERGPATLSGYRYGYRWDPEETPVSGLDVEWARGSVELRVSDASLIRITEKSDGRDLAEADKLKLSFSGGVLRIKWNRRLLGLTWLDNTRKDLVVDLPRSLMDGSLKTLKCANAAGDITLGEGFAAQRLELSSASGSVLVPGFEGESAKLSSVSGNVQARGLALSGKLETATVSGDQEIQDFTAAQLSLDTVSGGARCAGAAQAAETDSVSGDVRLELAANPETVEMDSVSGSLTLALPAGSGFRASYGSVSGRFTSSFDGEETGKSRSGEFTAGDGSATLRLNTTSGDMAIVEGD